MHGQTITRDELAASAVKQREEWREYSKLSLFGDALERDEADCRSGKHHLRAMDPCGCNVIPTSEAAEQGCTTSAVFEFCIICPDATTWLGKEGA